MCGIVGVFGNITPTMKEVFGALLLLDTTRGIDSTGVALCNNGSSTVLKDTVLPGRFMKRKAYKKHIDRPYKLLLGHNRWATKGKVNVKNSHPFKRGHITMVHNGTLFSSSELSIANYGTDSEAVCHSIQQNGIKDTWSKLNGAACLMWWDNKENSLNLVRNHQRPMHWACIKGNVLLFASEKWMIDAVMEKFDLEIVREGEENKASVWEPNPNYHFKFKYTNKKLSQESEKLDPFVYRAWKNPGKSYGGYGSNGANYNNNWPSKGDYAGKYDLAGTLLEDDDPDWIQRRGHHGEIIWERKLDDVTPSNWREQNKNKLTENLFRKNYSDCIFCGENVQEEWEDCVIIDDDTVVCNDCAATAERESIMLLG